MMNNECGDVYRRVVLLMLSVSNFEVGYAQHHKPSRVKIMIIYKEITDLMLLAV